MPHLDPGRRVDLVLPAGGTIAEIAAAALPGLPASRRGQVVATIAGEVVPHELWLRLRPRPGAVVVLRVVPGGDTGRAILGIAVLLAAAVVAPYLAGLLGFTSGTLGFALASAGIGVGISVAGTLLINAFIPLRQGDNLGQGGSSSPAYTIQGLRNVANPGGPIPDILGRHRVAPVYAALPYTESIGDDQYVIAAFLFGFGPLTISDLRLGDTPISNFTDLQYELREGLPDDDLLTLYPQQVIEEALSVQLTSADGAVIRVTAADAADIGVELAFPGGLFKFDDNGNIQALTVQVSIRQRPIGTIDWQAVTTLNITAAEQKDQLRRGYRWTLPARGRYEIELMRVTAEARGSIAGGDAKANDRCTWAVLRSFRPEYPINFDKPLALASLRIKATGQLQGVLDNFNAIAERRCPDYDAATGTWITRETRRPASLYRHMLQGPANVFPKADSEIDLDALASWHSFCVDKDLEYNRVHDFSTGLLSALADCAATGRVSPHDNGVLWSVAVDRIKSTVVGHISPRNSWNFSGTRNYTRFPDAFRVPFKDETNNYADAEMIVPWPGFVGDPQVIEELQHPGGSKPDFIWRETRRRQYELINRPDTYKCSQDVESLAVARGDLVMLNHDVLDREQKAARVKSVSGRAVTLDERVTLLRGQDYACRFRLAGGATLRRPVVRPTLLDGAQQIETDTLRLVGDLTGLAAGDLAQFGTAARSEAFEAIVLGVRAGDNLTAELTLADHAPQIETLVDAEVPPAWDGRVGFIADLSAVTPPVPVILSIEPGEDVDAVVLLRPGPGGAATAKYEARYRQVDAVFWQPTIVVDAADGAVEIDGFGIGITIEVQVRALALDGTPSAYSASTEFVVHIGITADNIFVTVDSTVYHADAL